MPITLKTKRRTRANLSKDEREKIIAWLQEGLTVAEVYHRCIDDGFPPPSEEALYYTLRQPVVQDVLKARKELETRNRIASLVKRTEVREQILSRIEALIAERAEAYAGMVAGGATGLVTLADRKSVVVGRSAEQTEYEVYEVYKADTALLAELRGVLRDQDESDDRLRKSLRHLDEHRARMDAHALNLDAGEIQLQLAEHELASWKAEAEPAPEVTVADDSSSQPSTRDTGADRAPFEILYEEQDRA